MATVYLGRAYGARGFERVVAIKVLHPALETNADIVAMFFSEARVAARIHHPNVVATLDVDDADGHCIVMEYVEGDQLLGLLRVAAETGKPIAPSIVLRIAIDVLSGLHAAHELATEEGVPLRVVHRDVSPQNLLVGVDGVTRVTDFGVAKVEDVTHARSDLKGKLGYMAPEQARRETVDRRADIFAAGIVIWELFTSRRLFMGENSGATLTALLSAPIPTLSAAQGLPESISQVVARALARQPDQRFPTALAFADALEQAAESVGGVASPKRVAEHIMRVSGDKIGRERERLRESSRRRHDTGQPIVVANITAATLGLPENTHIENPGAAPPSTESRRPESQPLAAAAAKRVNWRPYAIGAALAIPGIVLIAYALGLGRPAATETMGANGALDSSTHQSVPSASDGGNPFASSSSSVTIPTSSSGAAIRQSPPVNSVPIIH